MLIEHVECDFYESLFALVTSWTLLFIGIGVLKLQHITSWNPKCTDLLTSPCADSLKRNNPEIALFL